jgi:hypothetical protein
VDEAVIVADTASFESISERDAEAVQAKGLLNKPTDRHAISLPNCTYKPVLGSKLTRNAHFFREF